MKKKRSNKRKTVPQKGDPDYLTPTQLRNRRKRRAKQQKQLQKQQRENGNSSSPTVSNDAATNGKHDARNDRDPSMKYIANPTKAPVVRDAKAYFAPLLRDCAVKEFRVHLGPLYGWRTVSKLAVRPATTKNSCSTSSTPKAAFGLFLPQSHELVPVPKCRAHHPAINRAVECLERACHEVGVVPYEENREDENASSDDGKGAAGDSTIEAEEDVARGSGQLKYVAVNIARETGQAQITIVWNTHPPSKESAIEKEGGSMGDSALEKFVARLISMSNGNDGANPSVEGGIKRPANTEDDGANGSDKRAPRKKRRRGRREGGCAAKETFITDEAHRTNETNSNRISQKEASLGTSAGKQSKGKHSTERSLNLHSLWINHNPSWKHSNAIFSFESSCWRHMWGPRAIVEHLTFGNRNNEACEGQQPVRATSQPPRFPIPLHFPPNVFRQANLDAFTNIIARIRERIQMLKDEADNTKGLNCVELYGGVGTIGLHISDLVSSLVSSDENPNNAICFSESVHELPEHIRSRLTYKKKNADDMVSSERPLLRKSQVLIVDPPRKGLDANVVDYLCREGYKNLELMVYVSCGFRAFQRDCDKLRDSGRWRVEFAEGHLLFPGSDAIETLAYFVPA